MLAQSRRRRTAGKAKRHLQSQPTKRESALVAESDD